MLFIPINHIPYILYITNITIPFIPPILLKIFRYMINYLYYIIQFSTNFFRY